MIAPNAAATSVVLVAAVAGVGVLHTMVPDHWAPIVAIARSRGWTRMQTARAAALAGVGHVTSTLAIGVVLWFAGSVLAQSYAHLVDRLAAVALLAFGGWFTWGAWRELREEGGHGHEHFEHAHEHVHGDGTRHVHWHAHHLEDWHDAGGAIAVHRHDHSASGRTALLLVLGSSPMLEGLPAFFAASSYGPSVIAAMAGVFALATIVTYVALATAALAGTQRLSLGSAERYGEVFSGLIVVAVGIYALLTG